MHNKTNVFEDKMCKAIFYSIKQGTAERNVCQQTHRIALNQSNYFNFKMYN